MRTSRLLSITTAAATAGLAMVTVLPAHAAAPGRCMNGSLSLSHTRQDIGAGNGEEHIVFTNTGSSSCELTGFPGVSYVAKSGRQLGAAADRDGSSHGPVVLVPGGQVRARLRFINNVSAVPGCYHHRQQAQAVGLRVYPPGSTAAVFVRDPHPACKSPKVHLLSVGAVRAAA